MERSHGKYTRSGRTEDSTQERETVFMMRLAVESRNMDAFIFKQVPVVCYQQQDID